MSSWADVAWWIAFLAALVIVGTALMIWPDVVVSIHTALDRLIRHRDREVTNRTTARIAIGGGVALGLALGVFGLLFHVSRLP